MESKQKKYRVFEIIFAVIACLPLFYAIYCFAGYCSVLLTEVEDANEAVGVFVGVLVLIPVQFICSVATIILGVVSLSLAIAERRNFGKSKFNNAMLPVSITICAIPVILFVLLIVLSNIPH